MKVRKATRDKWTKEDEDFIRQNAMQMSYVEIGKILNRHPVSICEKCAEFGIRKIGQVKMIDSHPELQKEWDFSRNEININSISTASSKLVWWNCTKDETHSWRCRVCSRTKAKPSGCPYCCNHLKDETNSLASLRPDLASEWDERANKNRRPEDYSIGSCVKVSWICNKHKIKFDCQIRSRALLGKGCHLCIRKGQSFGERFPEQSKTWHPTKNGNITPWDVNHGSNRRYFWLCDVGHEWESCLSSRKTCGCPICSKSKGELNINTWLTERNITFTPQYKFPDCIHKRRLVFDFHITHNNQIYLLEYNGRQHYMPLPHMEGEEGLQKTRIRDKVKIDYCQDNNISLTIIPYWDFNRIDEILTNLLLVPTQSA